MPELLEQNIEESVRQRNRRKPRFKGRTARESAYAIMQSIGAMHGSKITPKGERMEKKLREEA